MPHSAFQGQTPDEVFFGIGDEVSNKICDDRKTAREEPMRGNRAARCGRCTWEISSGALLLQRPRSRMSWDAARIWITDDGHLKFFASDENETYRDRVGEIVPRSFHLRLLASIFESTRCRNPDA